MLGNPAMTLGGAIASVPNHYTIVAFVRWGSRARPDTAPCELLPEAAINGEGLWVQHDHK